MRFTHSVDQDGYNKKQKYQALEDNVEKDEPSYTASGNVKWCMHFGKNSDNSSNDQTHDPTVLLLDIYPRNENMCSWTQKSLYVTIYSSIIHNSKKKQPKYL